MSRRSHQDGPRVATGASLPATALILAALLLLPAAAAASRLRPPAGAEASAATAEVARIAAYWTPQRLRSTPPLDGSGAADPLAAASFAPVEDSTQLPFAVNGRIFVRQGRRRGYCSGTAIDSPTRRLILTAGHCANTGPRGRTGSSAWSRYVEFVPAFAAGTAPFGKFIARRPDVFAPKPWVKEGNPNFDIGAILLQPNASGVNVADAVGGGAGLGLNMSRKQRFETFGYPGEVSRLQRCDSPATGEDTLTRRIPGPPTVQIRCHWQPGASGGGWLVGGGTTIDGLTSYGRDGDKKHTFGPYFSAVNVGELVRGL